MHFSLLAVPSPRRFASGHHVKIAVLWLAALAALQFTLACSLGLGVESPKPVPQTIETIQGPRALAFDGEHVWVVFFGAETVAKYSVDGRNIASFSTDSLSTRAGF